MASKILLADDSITIQKVVNLTFADEDIEVVAVSNGDLAERRLVDVHPDLVLADIFMPGKNGYELCEMIKSSPDYHHIPVVLLVGAFEPFDQMEANRVKADAHLTKPFESRNLVETVRRLINNSAKPAPPRPAPVAEETRIMGSPHLFPTEPTPFEPIYETGEATPAFTAPVADEFLALSQTSPLNLDFVASFVNAPAPPANPAIAPATEAPVNQDITLSFQDDEESAPTSSAPAAPAEAIASAEPVATQTHQEPETIGVASTFGYSAQDMFIDFSKAPDAAADGQTEVASADPEAIVSFEAEPAVVTSASPLPASSPETPDIYDAEAAVPEVQPEPLALTHEVATAEVSREETTELLADENPLGDVWVDNKSGLEAAAELDTAASPIDEVLTEPIIKEEFEPRALVDELEESEPPPAAEQDLPLYEDVADADVETVVAKPNGLATMADDELPVGDYIPAGNHATEMAAQAGFNTPGESTDLPLIPEALLPTQESWPKEELHFTAIDAEASNAEETHIHPVQTEVEPVFAASEPAAEMEPPATPASTAAPTAQRFEVSEEMIEEIVRRVVERMSDKVVRDIAWEVVPDYAERILKEVTHETLSK